MPSDPRVALALAALARPIADFRAALTGAADQAETFLVEHAAGADERTARAEAELGAFAAGRLDAARFDAIFAARDPLPESVRARLTTALKTLRDVLRRGDELFVVDVPAGASLGTAIASALGTAGRGFGAAMAVDLLRSGAWVEAEHGHLLTSRTYDAWTRAERRFAPPLVVTVRGTALQVGPLSEYLDGREKIVLVVEGECPPAALVRLITPGTLVLQTVDGTGLDRVASAGGPAIAAFVAESAARFLHDPAGGLEPWQRLSVQHVPEAPRKAIGTGSVWQMQEDLRQLESLAAAPLGAPLPSSAPQARGGNAVDQLASWLLSQADLGGVA